MHSRLSSLRIGRTNSNYPDTLSSSQLFKNIEQFVMKHKNPL
jgi:hypothetical protein